MLAPEFRPDPSSITRVISDPQFLKYRSELSAFMLRSRELRGDAEGLIYLQAEMARELINLQKSRREFKARVASGDKDPDVQRAADVCGGLSHLIKQIADGLAWRSLDYDRGAIRELAAAPQTGHMEMAGLLHELEQAATQVGETGNIVVLNDLTNFLRYGDLTIVSPTAVLIEEVKASEGSARSGRAKRQKRRIREVTTFISRGERRTESGVQQIIRVRAPPKAHVRDLEALFVEARATGSVPARLSDVLAVELFAIELLAERGSVSAEMFHNPFAQSKQGWMGHSVQWFGRFSPNVAPYSVFPLPTEDCVALMAGEIWLVTYWNFGNLVRCLRRRGLQVHLPDEQAVRNAPRLRPGEIADHELDHPLVIEAKDKVLLISFAQLGRIEVELLDEESFADAIVELLALPADPDRVSTWCFEDERTLWD